MNDITEEFQVKIDRLDEDMQSFVKKLIRTSQKSESRLEKIMKQSDSQQLQLMKLTEEMQIISQTDKLTSMFNRLKCESQLNDLADKKAAYSIMILDIDNFKNINEKFNTLIADQVLVQMSKILKRFANNNFLGRWSGDTFMLINETSTLDEMIEDAEKICDSVENYFFDDVGQVTVSIGVSSVQNHFTMQDVINSFNKSLKKAKVNGKNQVSV